MKYAKSPRDIPEGKHWAALEFGSITIPGDERSKTCPGHGYPEHSETTISYIIFADMEEVTKWVERKESSSYRDNNYIIIQAEGRKIQRTVAIV